MAHAKLRSIIYDAKRIIEAAFIFLNRSFFDFILGNGLHLHAKDENGTLIDSLRVDFDISFILWDYCFANNKSQTDAFLIHRQTFSFLQLAESLEEFTKILWSNTTAWVTNVHDQSLLNVVVVRVDLNITHFCKFDRVFYNIDKNLLKTNLIAQQAWQLQ